MKKTILLIAILATLAVVYFLFVRNSGGSSMSADEIAFAVDDTASVQKIELILNVREVEKERVVLSREAPGKWLVNGQFRARQKLVENMLGTMQLLQVEERLTRKGQQTALGRLKKNHTQVLVYGPDGLLKDYLIGAVNQHQTGNIMMLTDKDVPYVMSRGDMEGYVSIYYPTNSQQWRENLLFDLRSEDIASLYIDYKDRDEILDLRRETAKAKLLPYGQESGVDEVKLDSYLSQFKGKIYAESFAEVSFPGITDSLVQRTPDIRFAYQTFSGPSDTLSLWVRPENPNNYFGKLSSSQEMLTVQHFVFDKLLAISEDFAGPAL